MEAFFKDLKHSLRMFAQSPAFTGCQNHVHFLHVVDRLSVKNRV